MMGMGLQGKMARSANTIDIDDNGKRGKE